MSRATRWSFARTAHRGAAIPGESTGPVEIAIGTHELGAAWLNGAGGLKINRVKGLSFQLSVQGSGTATIGRADVDQLNVGIAGTASATLAGRVAKMTAVVRGISALDAAGAGRQGRDASAPKAPRRSRPTSPTR